MDDLISTGLGVMVGCGSSGTLKRKRERTSMGRDEGFLLRKLKQITFHGVGNQPFKTARRYFISRILSYVGRSVGPTTSSISALRRSNTSG